MCPRPRQLEMPDPFLAVGPSCLTHPWPLAPGLTPLPPSQVFDLLLVNYEAVVLAVYRSPSLGSELAYVSSPAASESVKWDDRLFVVAPPSQVEHLLNCTERFQSEHQRRRRAKAAAKSGTTL